MDNLPSGWIRCELGAFIDVSTGKLDANAASEAGAYPFFTCSETVSRINCYAFDTEAVLLAGNGGFGVKWYQGKFNAYQRTYVMETSGVDGRFLYRQVQWLLPAITDGNRGSTIRYLRIGDITGCASALPPLPEQRRIVAKLEALTEKSRRAKEALDAIPPLLERFRQSVLAAAFRGDLTAEWRAKNPDVEPADKLLQRIRTERRRRWEETELAKMQAKGKTPGDDRWKEKYDEPEPVDSEDLPELPDGWAWASMGELTSEARIGLVRAAVEQSSTNGVAYVRMQHYDAAGRWNSADLTRVSTTAEEKCEYELKEGDVLFNTRNSYELVGKVAIWGKNRPDHVFNNNLMRLRFVSNALPKWMAHQMVAPAFLGAIARFKSATTSICAIYGRDLFRLPVLVAPVREQIEANRLMDESAARLDLLRRSTVDARSAMASLDRSILAKAFRGDLVPQDPSDEPASVLLDRIRQERAAAASAKEKKPAKRR